MFNTICLNSIFEGGDRTYESYERDPWTIALLQKLALLLDGYHNFDKHHLEKEIVSILGYPYEGGVTITALNKYTGKQVTFIGDYHSNKTHIQAGAAQ